MLTDVLEQKMHWEHYQKYEALAQRLGVHQLMRYVPFSKNTLAKSFAIDPYFNDNLTRLRYWDACHWLVVSLVRNSGGGVWSLSDSVCVLKHVARYHILHVMPPVEYVE